MSKRRLSQQQHNRIADRQKQATGDHSGLVIAHYGKEVDVARINSDGNVDLDSTERCHFRANLPLLVCGDRVSYQSAEPGVSNAVIVSLLERETLIERPRPYQPPKPVAANIDTIVLVLAVEPPPIASLVDRYLVAAENAGLEIFLLVNKYDRYPDADPAVQREIDELLALYRSLGYRCYRGSASEDWLAEGDTEDGSQDDTATQSLASLFEQRNSILVGQSGVGKSSIINAIAKVDAAVGEVSAANTKGRHTTTTASLYFLDPAPPCPISGTVIDSPGIREFGLWHLDHHQLIDGMRELRNLATQCKFRDCDHEHSKGCAIQQAISEGQIDSRRLSSYRQILESLQAQD